MISFRGRRLAAALMPLLILAAAGVVPSRAEEAPRHLPYVDEVLSDGAGSGSNLIIQTSPQFELVLLVAALADDNRSVNPPRADNPLGLYWTSNTRQFGAEEAVTRLRRLRASGLWGDRLLEFALHLGPLPDLQLLQPWSGDVVQAATGNRTEDPTAELDALRREIQAFAGRIRFSERYAEKAAEYGGVQGAMRAALGVQDPLQANAEFWGIEPRGDYYVIPSPLMNGGYVASLEVKGRKHEFLAFGPAVAGPVENPRFLHHMVFHELSHSLVDPVIASNSEALQRSAPLWVALTPYLTRNPHVLTWDDAVGEHLMRAYNIFRHGEKDPVLAELYVGSESAAGYHLVRMFLGFLEEFHAGGEKWSSFTDYMPVMVAKLESAASRSEEMVPRTSPPGFDLENPGFEEKRVGWMIPGWGMVPGGQMPRPDGTRNTAVVRVDDQVAHDGKRSLRIDVAGDTTDLVAVEQGPLAIRSGGTLRLSGWIKTRDVQREGLQQKVCGFYVQFLNAAGKVLSRGETDSAIGTLDWTELGGEFTAPAGASRFRVGILLGMTGTTWVDDVKVERED